LSKLSHLKIQAIDLGQIGYKEAWDLQKKAQTIAENDPTKGFVFYLEHNPVVTFGKNADFSHLTVTKDSLLEGGVDVVESDRGGQVTAHMPGQLVVYPVLNLGKAGMGPKTYVCKLEQSIIDFLDSYGIKAKRDPVNPGVWVGMSKICAVGIRISRRVSLHGLALNISNSFELFEKMTPCGISGRGVTSLEKELGREFSVKEVMKDFSKFVCKNLFENDFEILSFEKNMLQ
jgi:lipoate-protein ligase B